ncbi:MAG TPA: type II secretion system F family protein [Aldersonia sp.]
MAVLAVSTRGPVTRLAALHPTVPRSKPKRDHADPLAVATTFDLLAACLRAGLPMPTAVGAIAALAPASLRESLRRSADLLALGADPEVAWRDAAADPATESLARVVRRSAASGSSLARTMDELARRRRQTEEDAAVARAERAGVLIGGPLGLCFLPAFVCLGIVPVVIGLAGRVLGGGLV